MLSRDGGATASPGKNVEDALPLKKNELLKIDILDILVNWLTDILDILRYWLTDILEYRKDNYSCIHRTRKEGVLK